MGTTFVYNSGESTTAPGTLEKTYGMFFDGTGNNLRNTEIRKKVQQVEEYKYELATADERKIYRKEAKTTKHHWYGYKRSANSFMNDFSNVARMFMVCEEDYTVYTEGIGTENEEDDDIQGSAFGTGDRGVRARVRKGCESLVEKIASQIKKDTKLISLTLDVSGFSRGAAAARNFVYEVKKGKYKPWQKPVPGGRGMTLPADSFGEYVSDADLIDGELPPFGHLGLALLRNGVDKELVKNLKVNIRFVGVYDTVASYGVNHEKGVQRLNLDHLGVATKVVHFTAMDEHRKNFALTRVKTGIEKNFPGVHSDIGGGYDNGDEYVDELETDYTNRKYRKVLGDPLEQFGKKLVEEGWYFEDELEIHHPMLRAYRHLSGTREYVGKEYSYLILHYMESYAKDYLLNNEIVTPTIEKYPISSHPLLIKAKDRLDSYVKEGGKEWTFHKEEKEEEETEEENTFQFWVPDEPENTTSNSSSEDETTFPEQVLEEIVVIGHSNKLLKELRHGYFHWSADYDWVGMNPTKDRKRIEI